MSASKLHTFVAPLTDQQFSHFGIQVLVSKLLRFLFYFHIFQLSHVMNMAVLSLFMLLIELLRFKIYLVFTYFSLHMSWTWLSFPCLCTSSSVINQWWKEGRDMYIWHQTETVETYIPGTWCCCTMYSYRYWRGLLCDRVIRRWC